MSNVVPFRTTRSDGKGSRLGARAKTENVNRIPKRELEEGRRHLELVDMSGRPLVRGDCIGDVRPCPWVACSHNLFLDVTGTGGIKSNFPDVEPEDMDPLKSCALDVADQGGTTLEDVASTMNLTRERVRQLETKALRRLRRRSASEGSAAETLREFSDAPASASPVRTHNERGSVFVADETEHGARADELPDDADPVRVSFFSEPGDEDVDDIVAGSVWRMFARASQSAGIDCRSKASIRASAAYARRNGTEPKGTPTEADDMAKQRGEMQRLTAETIVRLERRNGGSPTAREVYEELGEAAATSIANVRETMKRLAKKAINGEPVAVVPRAKRSTRRARPEEAVEEFGALTGKAKSGRAGGLARAKVRLAEREPTSAELAAIALVEARDDLRRRADVLDAAIGVLR